ncbi:MAG: MG2 domain-containing protein [Ignavibacteria bacterium]|nr:MG2 domain-containing protein [Ignavibacteria bacterium]
MKTNKISVLLLIAGVSLMLTFSGSPNSIIEGSLYISNTKNFLPNKEVKINVSAYDIRNKNLKIRVYKVIDLVNFYKELPLHEGFDKNKFREYEYEDYLKLVKEFKFNLPLSSYNWANESYSLGKYEDKGVYIVVGECSNLKALSLFTVSKVGMIVKYSENQLLGFVQDRLNSKPISNAKINLFQGKDIIASTSTNSEGIFYYRTSARENKGGIFVIGKKGDDEFISDNLANFYRNEYERFKVYTYTNQPVYRPLQKVNFKSIIKTEAGNTLTSYANKDVTVSIRNPKNEEVYSKKLKTNGNGSVNDNFELDEEPPLGIYTINVIVNSNTYSSNFSVEEYKKPEYKVEVTTDKSQYTFKDKINVNVKADYYFGSPVTNAEVKYEIYRNNIWRPWWYYDQYAWFYKGCFIDYYPRSEPQLIEQGEGKISSDGKFVFSYNIDEKSDIDYEYTVVAKVIDQSRREIEGSKKVFVTRGEFQLSTNPEKYLFKPKERVQLKVTARDFADKPIVTKFTVYIRKQVTEYNDTYIEEIDTLLGETKSDGVGFVYFSPQEDGRYTYLVKAYDSRKNLITAKGNFWINDGGYYWDIGGGIQIITDKEVYEYGDGFEALITTPVENAIGFFTIESNDIHEYQTIKIEGYSTNVTKRIKENYPTVLNLNISFFNDNIYYSGQKRIAVLPKKNFLTVDIKHDKDTYKPNSTSDVTIFVKDYKGFPVPNTELSIGTIDESIYAIQDDTTPEIQSFFYSGKNYYITTIFTQTDRSYEYEVFEKESDKKIDLDELEEKGNSTIYGRVIDENTDKPIGRVEVILIKGRFQKIADTDDDGKFSFRNIEAGEYSIIFKIDGYEKKAIRKLKLKANEVRKLSDVMMTPYTIYPNRFYRYYDYVADAPMLMSKVEREEQAVGLGRSSTKEAKEFFVPAQVRSDFKDAILWEPTIVTDKDGKAKVSIKFPDNLTTWRTTVKAVTHDTKVGQSNSKVITRKDLIVRMETPRFLREKDEITISTIVHNYLSTEKLTKVSLKVKNARIKNSFVNSEKSDFGSWKFENGEYKITIKKDSETRIDWIVSADEPAKEIIFKAEALTNEESDAMEIKVPVLPYGVDIVETDIASAKDFNDVIYKTVTVPKNAELKNVSLTITTSPSLAGTILGALDDLVGYPYGCVEQTMSRFLPTILVANTFYDLNAPLKEGTIVELPKMVQAGLKRLYDFQHSDGGWGWWTNDQTHPFMTAYVVYGLALTKKANYKVDESVFTRGVENLKQQLLNGKNLEETTRAYMLYSLAFAMNELKQFDYKLFEEEFSSMPEQADNPYVTALLTITADKMKRKKVAEKYASLLSKSATTDGSGVFWSGKDWHYRWDEDQVQTTALAVRALINYTKDTDMIEKAVRWLLLQKRGTSWNSTKQTAMVIFALTDYLKTSKELEPNFSVNISINDEPAISKSFTKANLFDKEIKFTLDSKFLKAGENKIKIVKTGEGKLYYSSLLKYFSKEKINEPMKNNFVIERDYYFIQKEKEGDEFVSKLVKFSGRAKSGDEIFVRIKVKNNSEKDFFILEDPIPPGCEVVKESDKYFIQGERNYSRNIFERPIWRWFYADKEVRDEKVAFFVTQLGKGEFEFTYILRAQIPGNYNVMPSTGMLMYYPEVRGTSKSNKFVIYE